MTDAAALKHDFHVGQKVVVIDKNAVRYGEEGKITRTDATTSDVKFTDGKLNYRLYNNVSLNPT